MDPGNLAQDNESLKKIQPKDLGGGGGNPSVNPICSRAQEDQHVAGNEVAEHMVPVLQLLYNFPERLRSIQLRCDRTCEKRC